MATPMVFPPPRNPDDPGRGPLIVGITWLFTGLATIAATLRMYVGKKRKTGLAIDDWIMFVAMSLQLVNQALITKSYLHGLGKHDADLQLPYQLVEVLKWSWIAMSPGMLVSILARISITILLIRLFGIHAWFKWFLMVLTTIQVILGSLVFIVSWAQVKPVECLWNPFLTPVERWDRRIMRTLMYLGQSTYTFADLTYVIIPVAIIWRLNMDLHRRIGLTFLMGVSVFTAGMSIAKTVMSIGDSDTPDDAQYRAALTLIWAGGEQACVVFLGCVPPLAAGLSMDMKRLRSLGVVLSEKLGSWASSNKGSTVGNPTMRGGSSDGGYYDLETNTHKLAGLSNSAYKVETPAIAMQHDDAASDKSLVASGRVKRTDAFTVEFNDREQL